MNAPQLAVLALSALPACATTGTRVSRPADTAVTVVVENHNWSDVVLYAVRNGYRVRLGMVTSQGRRTLRMPQSMTASGVSVQLQVDPIGSSRTWTTEPILVRPGSRIEFEIENHLPFSTYSVWD